MKNCNTYFTKTKKGGAKHNIAKAFLEGFASFSSGGYSKSTEQKNGKFHHCTVLLFSKEGGTKVKGLLAVEHQIKQLFTSIYPPNIVGPGAFWLFGHNYGKTMFL